MYVHMYIDDNLLERLEATNRIINSW